mgnify:CR=1 FL=1
MAQAIVSWSTLVLGTIGMLFAWCGLKSRHGTIDKLSTWYLGFGLPGSELSALLATLGAVFAAVAWALDAQARAAGQVGLVLHGLAIAGLHPPLLPAFQHAHEVRGDSEAGRRDQHQRVGADDHRLSPKKSESIGLAQNLAGVRRKHGQT